uniref:Variant surface glycoprotein 1125.4034 n=1 Tax=Trypanosoma brucei TaxID=5691 RepID=A0A1J0R9M3_9TRYP|nr:variant surface glycoprotein 1125.4034 [Trypanosoma brucei]
MENQQYKRAVAPTLAILLVITVAATCQRKADPAATAISNACDEEYYLHKLKHHVSSLLDRTKQTIVEQQSALRKLRLAQAAATEHEHRCLLHGIAAALAEALEVNTRTVEKNEGMIDTALKHISKQQQTVAAAIALSKINTKVTNGAVHTGGSGASNKVTIKLTTDDSLTGACSVTAAESTRTIGGAEPDVANVHTTKLTAASKLHKAAGQTDFSVTAKAGCANAANQEAKAAFDSCTFAAGATAVATATAAAAHSAYSTPINIYSGTGPGGECHADVKSATSNSPQELQLGQALCNVLKLQITTAETPAFDGPTLQGNGAALTAVAACDARFKNLLNPTDSTKNTQLSSYVKEAYGSDTAAFKKKFASLIDEKKVPIVAEGKTTMKPIKEVTSAAEETQALGHLEKQRTEREEEAAKDKSTVATEAEKVSEKGKECKGEADKDKCKEKDGCEFKNGECKAKVTKSAATDGKTNTTASNSFVIHKAPLLFVFLLI